MAHITGGGLPENLPRIFPPGLSPRLDKTSWEIPELFNWLQNAGDIPEIDLWNTFNMGIGFCLIVPKNEASLVLEICKRNHFMAWNIGQVVESQDHSKDIDIFGFPI